MSTTLVQANIYRRTKENLEYLLLKRNEVHDGFWQPVTGQVRAGESPAATLKRALTVEVGLKHFEHLSEDLYSYEWYWKGNGGRDIVFAAEIAPDVVVTLDSDIYETYQWLSYEAALKILVWDGNKEALKRLHEHLTQDLHSDNATPPSVQ